jgi:GntR family transcriptional regulator, transcriptional repressor for pyruvate dehydrogenase complex
LTAGPSADGRRPRRFRSASERVAAEIQHHIQRAGLGPGDHIGREEDLAAEFGVSRPTLREALKLLSRGNLVHANKGPGGGIFVAHTADEGLSRSLSEAISMMLETGAVSLGELLDARMMIEVPIAGLAAHNADTAAIDWLRAIAGCEHAAAHEDYAALVARDGELHRAIASVAGGRILQALSGWMFDVLQPSLMRVLDQAVVRSALIEQHEALISAIERGDAQRAERAMKDHVLYLGDVLLLVQN